MQSVGRLRSLSKSSSKRGTEMEIQESFQLLLTLRKKWVARTMLSRRSCEEVEYKSKSSSSNTGNESSNKKELPKENAGSNEFKENMSSYITVDAKIRNDGQAVAINGMVTSDSSCLHSEVKKGPKVSVSFDKIKFVPDIDSSKCKAEDPQQSPENSYPEKPEDVKEETCKPMLDIDGSKSKAEEHRPSSSENPSS